MKNYNSKRYNPGEYFPMPKVIFRLDLDAGDHEIEFVCYGNRNNTFGPIHNKRIADPLYYTGPMAWANNELRTEDFCFQKVGILAPPVIELYKN